ncbi:hypothetical protein LCGC14_2424090, partial [marine sediment metagenome]
RQGGPLQPHCQRLRGTVADSEGEAEVVAGLAGEPFGGDGDRRR